MNMQAAYELAQAQQYAAAIAFRHPALRSR